MISGMDLKMCFVLLDRVYKHVKARNDGYNASTKSGQRKTRTYEPAIELGSDGSGCALIDSYDCESNQEFSVEWDSWEEMLPAIRNRVNMFFEAVEARKEKR